MNAKNSTAGRAFLNEVMAFDQPLVTIFPRGHTQLPLESEVLDQLDVLSPQSVPTIPVSCLTAPKVGGFGRTAQATCLLDQVFKSFETVDIDSRLLQLDGLDTSIQTFLSLVIPQGHARRGNFCAAVHLAIRALFTLHWHILRQPPQVVRAKFKPLEGWYRNSQEALETVTKIVIDIAESLLAPATANTVTFTVDAMPLVYPYNARAALKHINTSTRVEDADWLRNADGVLKKSLDRYFERWGVSNSWT
ncbi:uncharacterized protein A1O9_02623 [Exophiala aquamarina CBS 119918]|uniref:Uncharacterized protein n=1 Tax=Exophiala aquamarina CBS 119918 TaxID=1182545 RepID=A0A072PNX6_9EURO|nr:uncharacterized protein A1O9_02623 [Exophiala aquamarina CBS 119918]KEF61058.1 hypothetical protein A1O9_02623 [Exophiala aquamarina CBS 119918]